MQIPLIKRHTFLKVVKYIGFVTGVIILTGLLIFVLFPDHFANTILKNQITDAFKKAYPTDTMQLGEMHYSIWKNRIGCDTIVLKTNQYKFRIVSLSVSGISWMKILWHKNITGTDFSNSIISIQKANIIFIQSQKELDSENLYLSIPDSNLVSDSIKYFSLINDDKYFAKSKYRQTRYGFNIGQVKIMGLDCQGLISGNSYKAQRLSIIDFFADILVNMDKPYDENSPNPQMPNEILSSIKEMIKVDSLKITNGNLNYSERFVDKAKPGKVTFNNANLSVSGITNHSNPSGITVIKGSGVFMKSGIMKLIMEIPLASKEFSLRYSGSLTTMNASVINSFIEAGEHRSIKSGIIKSAKFDINVISGKAKGELKVAYQDLSIVILNKKTGSENGIIDKISSLIGKLFVLRGTNLPDKNGKMKIGEIKYTRNPGDYFFQFIWFALRNGVADVVGLPQI